MPVHNLHESINHFVCKTFHNIIVNSKSHTPFRLDAKKICDVLVHEFYANDCITLWMHEWIVHTVLIDGNERERGRGLRCNNPLFIVKYNMKAN